MQLNLSQQTLHFRKPFRSIDYESTEHSMIVITMMDEKGMHVGLGECAPLQHSSCDADAYVRMSDVARLINEALQSDDYAAVLRPYPALLFALESAMFDYQQNQLLYSTDFAKSKVGIPLTGNIGMASYDEMLEQVKQCLKQGFRSLTLEMGVIEWDDMLRLLARIRSRFSKNTVELRVDANGLFSADEVMLRLNELSAYDVHTVIQPIKSYQWKLMAELCSSSPVAIALDAELTGVNTLEEKRLLLDTIRPQYIVVRPMLHGGISGSIEWVSEANKRGIRSWLGSAQEGNIGLRNVALLAARVYDADTMQPQSIDTGRLYSDNIEMDMEARGNKMWRWEVVEVNS